MTHFKPATPEYKVIRERACFRCGKPLIFEDYIKNNTSIKTEEQLTKIWNSKYIEFYCCHCYCFKFKFQPFYGSEK